MAYRTSGATAAQTSRRQRSRRQSGRAMRGVSVTCWPCRAEEVHLGGRLVAPVMLCHRQMVLRISGAKS